MLTHPLQTILGDIPAHWNRRQLKEVLLPKECCSGDWGEDHGERPLKVLRSTNFTNDGHLDLSDTEIRWFPQTTIDHLQPKTGDILLERSGGGPDQPVGRVVFIYVDMPGFGFGNFIQRLRPNAELVVPRYLRWVLHELHRSGIIERLQHQTTQMRNLDYRDYIRVYIPVPPEDEQQHIADAIEHCDKLVLKMKTMIGIRGSLHRDQMGGALNRLKKSLLQNLLTGKVLTTPESPT